MGFRDELEAARARIGALDREVETLRDAQRVAKRAEPPFAMLSAGLALGISLALAALAVTWSRANTAEESEARHRHEAAETERSLRQALSDANARFDTVSSGDGSVGGTAYTREELEHIDAWIHDGVFTEEWSGAVTERIGEAPVALGGVCSVRIERVRPSTPHAGTNFCRLSVRCGDDEISSNRGAPRFVQCRFDGHMHVDDAPRGGGRRVRGSYGSVALDDGPVGTWSMVIAAPPR